MAVPEWNGVGTEFELLDNLTLEPVYKLTVKSVTTAPTGNVQGECDVRCVVIDKTKSSYRSISSSTYQFSCTVQGVSARVNCHITDLGTCFKDCTNLTTPPSLPSTVTSMNSTFAGCISLTDAPTIPSGVTKLTACFKGCTSLTSPPTIPNGVTSLYSAFDGCSSLTTAPEIPNTVTNMNHCFQGCSSLTTAPEIPSSPNGQIYSCFYKCTSLAGNVVSYTHPVSVGGWGAVFGGTVDDIYVIDMTGTTTGKDAWVSEASHYSNVHYEADDNPVPALTMGLTRVGAMNSTTPVENGEYVYINSTAIIYDTYLPVGWSVDFGTKTLTLDEVTQSPVWTVNNVGNTYTLECWLPLGDTAKHTFTMQVSDSIKDGNNTVKASHDSLLVTQILAKAYKLVDYFHDDVTDTEGMSIGKFADEANLFDVDMPSRFRDSVIVDKLIGEIKMFAGDNIPTGWHLCDGSELLKDDYPLLYNAIGDIWGTPTDSDHFVLPNLMGRVPVGCDANDTDFDTVGNSGGTKDAIVPYHTHTQSAHSHATSPQLYRVENRFGSGSRNAAGTYSGYGAAVNTDSRQPAIQYAGTEGNAVGANLQPYVVVKYIICAA